MSSPRGFRAAACLLAGGLAVHNSRSDVLAFAVPRVNVQLPSAQALGEALPAGPRVVGQPPQAGFLTSLCGAFVSAAAAERVGRIVMQSQGQGGKNILGQGWMPVLKGCKRRHVYRPRKPYGSLGARQVPRRYPLYDLLEEYDRTLPTFTVVWEPEEPQRPVEDVPLLERYPWANSLEKVPKAKQEQESGPDKMERLFGSIVYENLPPISRVQKLVHRRGWSLYAHPPWLNKPLVGTAPKVPKNMPWKKDRRPKPFQYEHRPEMMKFMTEKGLFPKALKGKDLDLLRSGDAIDDVLEGFEDKGL